MMSVSKSITKGLKEAIEYEKGSVSARTAKVRVEPLVRFDKAEIKAIRNNTQMTQVVFARFLGVSPKTVEAWEAGRNMPDGPARRMLSMLKQDPNIPVKYKIVERSETSTPDIKKSSRRAL